MGVGRTVAMVVPWIELVIGLLVFAGTFSPWPSIAAGCLVVAFTVLIVLRIRDGSRPPCACFGARSSRPIGAAHVIRNVILLGLAAIAIGFG